MGGFSSRHHYGVDEMKETMTDLFIQPREAAYFSRRRSGKAKWWIAFIIAVLIGIGMNCLASGLAPVDDLPTPEMMEAI